MCLGLLVNAQQLSNWRMQQLKLNTDTLFLNESIVANSLQIKTMKGTRVNASLYSLNESKAYIYFQKPLPQDTLQITYRVFPIQFTQSLYSYDYKQFKNQADSVGFLIDLSKYTQVKTTKELFDFGKLRYGGDFSRGIRFGNGQSFNLNSSFNLQLSGMLSKDIEIKAAITDNNIPIQPEGNTANLQDFDNIFVQLAYKKHFLRLGDFDLKNQDFHFMRFNKNLQGLSYWGSEALSKNHTLKTIGNVSVAKGKYAINNLVAQEGNQGPYKLKGEENEQFIIVLSGSENVYINGEKLKRGINNDYIIDYNLGEIRFTSKRLITQDLRIRVEFEYADQDYLRLQYNAGLGVQHKIWDWTTNFYSEQDIKGQAINQNLSDTQKIILQNIGDSIQNAYTLAATATPFNKNKVLYEQKDTLFQAKKYTIFQYSIDAEATLYNVNFSYVGENKGNYTITQAVANGTVYQWVAPNADGSFNGNYDAVKTLVAPNQKQLLSTKVNLKPNHHWQVNTELALSNFDKNTFSTKDAKDNIGMATFIEVNNQQNVKKDSSILVQTQINYEYKHKNFNAIERYRNVEFQRNWNTINQNEEEHLAKLKTKLTIAEKANVLYQFQFFKQANHYTGFENKVQGNYGQKLFNIKANLRWLSAKSTIENTQFIRPKIEWKQYFTQKKQWQISANTYHEYKAILPKGNQNLSKHSFWWQNYAVGIQHKDSLKNEYALNYKLRLEHAPQNKTFAPAHRIANTVYFTGKWYQQKAHQLLWRLTYRNVKLDSLSTNANELEHYYLGKIQYRYYGLKGALAGNTSYEIGAGREQKIQYYYLVAPDGQGNFAWKDINQNGVQELNEFYVSNFTNENIYLRLLRHTAEFQAVNNVRFQFNMQILPKKIWHNSTNKAKQFLARFAVQNHVNLQRKTIRNNTINAVDLFSPIGFSTFDTALVSKQYTIRHQTFFNKNHHLYGMHYAFYFNASQRLLTSGFDRRKQLSHEWSIFWNIIKSIRLSGKYTNGYKQNNSDFYLQNQYQYIRNEASFEASFLIKKAFRIKANYDYAFRSNPMSSNGGQFAVINQVGLDFKYSKAGNFNILSRFKYSSVAYNDDLYTNERLSIDMLQGLENGNNYIWGVQIDKTIAKHFQISVAYDGRKISENAIIHTGKAQVRAVF